MCRKMIDIKEKSITDQSIVDKKLEEYIRQKVDASILQARMQAIEQQRKIKENAIRVEYGNYAELIQNNKNFKNKYKWTLFVKVLSSPIKNPISYIEYNINAHVPGSKPIQVSNCPWELERQCTYEFSCEIKIFWRNSLKLQPYTTTHYISFGSEKTSRKFIQQLSK